MVQELKVLDFDKQMARIFMEIGNDTVGANLTALLLPNENIIGTYKGIRDYVVFTDKRFIAVNVQGLTGKKQDYTSMPYKNINVLFYIKKHKVIDSPYFIGIQNLPLEILASMTFSIC